MKSNPDLNISTTRKIHLTHLKKYTTFPESLEYKSILLSKFALFIWWGCYCDIKWQILSPSVCSALENLRTACSKDNMVLKENIFSDMHILPSLLSSVSHCSSSFPPSDPSCCCIEQMLWLFCFWRWEGTLAIKASCCVTRGEDEMQKKKTKTWTHPRGTQLFNFSDQ